MKHGHGIDFGSRRFWLTSYDLYNQTRIHFIAVQATVAISDKKVNDDLESTTIHNLHHVSVNYK